MADDILRSPLRLLHVEDAADDGELLRAELEDADHRLRYLRVDNAVQFMLALGQQRWDVVVSDFNLPSFDAHDALRLLQQSGHDIPFIVVSGFIGEMEAVALMKAGAHDYVMKGRLARLGPAIAREMREAAGRAERRQAALELDESRRQLQELSAFLQQVREEEGTRIARELHDELGQALTALRIDLIWIDGKLPERDPKVGDKLAAMLGVIDKTVDTVRRISEDLRPGMLDDLGLAAAIESHLAKFGEQTGIACELAMSRQDYALDDRTATTLYRVLQESLTNVARHAKARTVNVVVQDLSGEILLIVKDDGCGMAPPGAGGKRSYGLIGMRERVRLLGGSLDVSSAAGKGTRIEVSLPLAAPARAGAAAEGAAP